MLWAYQQTYAVEQNPISGRWYAKVELVEPDSGMSESVFIKFQDPPSSPEIEAEAASICERRNAG